MTLPAGAWPDAEPAPAALRSEALPKAPQLPMRATAGPAAAALAAAATLLAAWAAAASPHSTLLMVRSSSRPSLPKADSLVVTCTAQTPHRQALQQLLAELSSQLAIRQGRQAQRSPSGL